MDINSMLLGWGSWKRYSVIGIGYSSATIESKIMEGTIFGDGNVGGQKSAGGVLFKENPLAESVDIAVKKLMTRHGKEMRVIKAKYITEWSVKKIARETKVSKYQIRQLLSRGETLIEGMLANQ